MKQFNISKNEAGQRFDKYLVKLLKNAPTSLIFKQLRNKNINLNGKKAKGNEILSENDNVQIYMSEDTLNKFIGTVEINEKIDISNFKVVYEDDEIILADKPVGILSQKAVEEDISMNEMLIEYLLEHGLDKNTLATFKPAFCNRLDRNTSGLMIGGKSLKGLQKMSEIIKDRSVSKFYLAIVKGVVTEKQSINGFLYKDENKNIVKISQTEKPGYSQIKTNYEPIKNNGEISLILVELITGKTHQIRAHLASIAHPIIGDNKYGDLSLNKKYSKSKQLLHSYKVIFPELEDEFSNLSNKTFTTEYPQRFKNFFQEI